MYNAIIKNSYRTEKKKGNLSIKLLIIIMIITTVILITISTQGSKKINYTRMNIEKGDTLWSIAKSLEVKNVDIRKIISEIRSINNLDGAILQPGDTIMIPDF